jgi:DNA (cytosine-5)-methyltransferase 1
MRELHLFAGAGGGILAGMLIGHTPVGAVEIDGYCRRVLQARQDDGSLPAFPIYKDVTTFNGEPWRGKVDIISGGFPCTDISQAGKGDGIDGDKSGLWRDMARITGEIQPRFLFMENSNVLISRGLTRIISDLARIGYDLRWLNTRCEPFGIPQTRRRAYALAYPERGESQVGWDIARVRRKSKQVAQYLARSPEVEPPMVGMVDGLASRMDRLKAAGNGQVAIVAATAFRFLSQGLI